MLPCMGKEDTSQKGLVIGKIDNQPGWAAWGPTDLPQAAMWGGGKFWRPGKVQQRLLL